MKPEVWNLKTAIREHGVGVADADVAREFLPGPEHSMTRIERGPVHVLVHIAFGRDEIQPAAAVLELGILAVEEPVLLPALGHRVIEQD